MIIETKFINTRKSSKMAWNLLQHILYISKWFQVHKSSIIKILKIRMNSFELKILKSRIIHFQSRILTPITKIRPSLYLRHVDLYTGVSDEYFKLFPIIPCAVIIFECKVTSALKIFISSCCFSQNISMVLNYDVNLL